MTGQGHTLVPSGVLGGSALSVEEYVAFLGAAYLADYLPAGGSAIKIAVVGDPGVADRLEGRLGQVAADRGCLYVALRGESTRLHMIDQIFFAVSRAVDWDRLAGDRVRAAYDDAGFPSPPGGELRVDVVARAHQVDTRELYRSVRRSLERRLLGDESLAPEMRRAMLRLSQAQLGTGDVDPAEHEAVLGWLRGELRAITALRSALIFSRIGRHNARAMLASTVALLLDGGGGGLVLHLDFARLAESRRPPAPARSGVYYSRAAVLDSYEVLRQFIDATDELRGLLLVAAIPPELVTDDSRGLPAYSALQLRVADEVRDRRRTNPFAALVRLDVRMEAVR